MVPASERFGIGRFEYLRALGSGGAGAVFEARDRETGERLAIKELQKRDGASLYHFKNEFRSLAELTHPNVVRFRELFEDSGCFYLTMELVEGEDLLEFVRPGASKKREASFASFSRENAESGVSVVRREQPSHTRSVNRDSEMHDGLLNVPKLYLALQQLSSGLTALHAAGLTHRDIKPGNVLVTRKGRVVLLDFGLAVDRDVAGQNADFAGTLLYMAPEQLAGLPVTPATDWYGVGVLLYEALTGRLPHPTTPIETFSMRRRLLPPAPQTYDASLPEDLCMLCMRLLEPDPLKRPGEDVILRCLGLDAEAERSRASFRSQLHFSRRVFVGRAHELAVLKAALGRSRTGGCSIVRIVGESGVGKSALIRRFVAESGGEQPDLVVLSGRCFERETVPFRGVDGIVDSLARLFDDWQSRDQAIVVPPDASLLAEVFPVIRALPGFGTPEPAELVRLDPQQARRLAFTALRDVLRALGNLRPLVIHLDDAQWLDPESVSLLAKLALGDEAPRMLLVFAQRPMAREPLTELLEQAADVTRVSLSPLSLEESETLVSLLVESHGGESPLDAASVARKSGGHPLFVHELVLHDAASAEAADSLESAVFSRINSLDSASRRLLELVSLASTPITHGTARSVADLGHAEYPWVLSALRAENLVSFQALSPADEVHAYHDRIRELVVERMTLDRRRQGHLRLAVALEAAPHQELGALAHHYLEGGAHDKASFFACAAAERAVEALAFEQATRFLEAALRIESEGAAKITILGRLGYALASAGRGADAARAYLSAAELSQGMAAVELRRLAGEQLLRSGHLERGLDLLHGSIAELGLHIPETDTRTLFSLAAALGSLFVRGLKFVPRDNDVTAEERLRLDACWTVATGLSMVHHLRATDFTARSLLLALRAGQRDRVLKSAALLGSSLDAMGWPGKQLADKLFARAQELVELSPSAENRAWFELNTGVKAMGHWDFAACHRACAAAEAVFRRHCAGVAWEVVMSQAFALWSQAFRGEFTSINQRLPELIKSARDRGDRHALATLILSPLHLAGLAEDAPERVRRECLTTVPEWPAKLACFQHMCAAYVLAQVDLYEAKHEAAWANVIRAFSMLRQSHLSRVQFQRVDLLGLRARAALGRASGGSLRRWWLIKARLDVKRLERERIRPALAMAALVEGGVLSVEGRVAEARRAWGRAANDFELQGMRLHARVAELARAQIADDVAPIESAENALREIGVVDPAKMLRLWVPGIEARAGS